MLPMTLLAKKEDDKNRCQSEAAERLVLEAERQDSAMLASRWLNAAIRQLHGQVRRTKLQTRDPPYMAAIARSSRSTKGDHVPLQSLRYVPCSATMLVFGSSEMEVAQELAAKRAEENSRQRSTESPSWQERAAWLLLCG